VLTATVKNAHATTGSVLVKHDSFGTMVTPNSGHTLETDAWKEEYLAHQQRDRRLLEMPAKLAKLGLDEKERGSKVLDLCCGSGETLLTLHTMGFRDLAGVDLTVPHELLEDARFHVVQGDALNTEVPSATCDWVLNIHAMHHFASAENVERFLAESYRVLKPGGKLGIIDFPNSPQIRLAFWFFRQNIGLVTPYLKYFGKLIQEEWSFLQHYLPQWPHIHDLLHKGRFRVVSETRSLFYFHLVLQKPVEERVE
jgi:ubiquinone/menaquinone biosynthesis C-methylase UbiE